MTTFASQTAYPADPLKRRPATELARARRALESQIIRLRHSLADSTTTNSPQARQMVADGEDEIYAGTLFADIAARSQLVHNSYAILEQCEHALQRIIDGRYGICDECAHPIATARLLAIPRATKCTHCR